uniref:Uncharacterized protein n=1 Tax=Oryza punctata TaxID=4537 RepID=A0A0E0KPK4_ORYPU
MADYEVAAHMLGECECRVAEAKICLQAKIDALQMEYDLLAKEVPKKEKEEMRLEKIIIEAGARFKAILRRNEEFLVDSQCNMDEVEPNLKSAITVVELGSVDQEYGIEEESALYLPPSSMQQPSSLGLISMVVLQ